MCLGVVSSKGFWLPEHIVQFTEMVEDKSFVATFKSSHSEQGLVIHKVELMDKQGSNVNQKFGKMTNTLGSDVAQRSVSTASNFGSDMKVTVSVSNKLILPLN